MELTMPELVDFIKTNKEFILWDDNNKHLLEQSITYSTFVAQKKMLMKRASSISMELTKTKYDFTILTRVLTYQDGSGFGELALMSKKTAKRAASIVCDEEVTVACLNKQAFQNSIQAALERKINLRVEFLKNFRLAENITRTTLVKLTQYLKEKAFRRRDVVYKEGEISDGVYFIREGEFEVIYIFSECLIIIS